MISEEKITTLRWQMGPFEHERSWLSLDTSIRLMKRLVPDAELHVTHQTSSPLYTIEGVKYHEQGAHQYPWGRHNPIRFNFESHEVWLDNDHLMWELPPGWKYWLERPSCALIWRTDWDYYGPYASLIHTYCPGVHASAGFFGLPPHRWIGVPRIKKWETDTNQEEMGWVVWSLLCFDNREYVYEDDEVTVYNPDHPVLDKKKVGKYGVHLMGMNRGFNPKGEELIHEIRREHGL